MSAVVDRPREETLDEPSRQSVFNEGVRDGVEAMGTSRLEAKC